MDMSDGGRRQRLVFWIALSILLFLRIPLESWMVYFFPSTSVWIEPVYEIGTYLLIVFLIWWERKALPLHHLDFLAVLIIALFKPISILLLPPMGQAGNPLALPRLPGLICLGIALVLLGLVLAGRIYIGRPNRGAVLWLGLGSVSGIALNVLYGSLMIGWLGYPVPPSPGPAALLAPAYQLGYAAVMEEPLFRGFLWGGLRRVGMSEFRILLLQAVLFVSAHLGLLNSPQPLLYFGITFVNAIILGLFVWRSRSLASSMALHGFANGSAIVQYWVYVRLFR